MSDYPEVIYLMEGDEGIVWCDDPDPSSCGEADSVEYIRADKVGPQAVTAKPDTVAVEEQEAFESWVSENFDIPVEALRNARGTDEEGVTGYDGDDYPDGYVLATGMLWAWQARALLDQEKP